MSCPKLGALSNNRWSRGTVEENKTEETLERTAGTNFSKKPVVTSLFSFNTSQKQETAQFCTCITQIPFQGRVGVCCDPLPHSIRLLLYAQTRALLAIDQYRNP